MRQCHILITSKPGSEQEIQRKFDDELRSELENEELGVRRVEQAELLPVFGQYDFIIQFNFRSFEDVGKHLLMLRSKLKDHIMETVTLLPRD